MSGFMEIMASAPAKLIMFGEHASRHGKPSIVFAIDQRLHVSIKPRSDEKIFLSAPDMGVEKAEYPAKQLEYITASIEIFLNETKCKKKGFDLSTKSEIEAGFGSSGAAVVATLGALNEFFGTKLKKFDILKLGQKVIWKVQGHGSGIDIASATYGWTILFEMDKEPKVITKEQLPIVIGNTGVKVKSKPIVEAVEKLEKKFPPILKSIIDNMGNIGLRAKEALEKNDLETVGQLMNINQGMLYGEGVSSLILEKMVFAAKEAGAYGAKLSGAGIGDNMIALVPEDKKEKVAEAINKAGGKALIAKISEGLRIEK
jgi:mevalonate kinase